MNVAPEWFRRLSGTVVIAFIAGGGFLSGGKVSLASDYGGRLFRQPHVISASFDHIVPIQTSGPENDTNDLSEPASPIDEDPTFSEAAPDNNIWSAFALEAGANLVGALVGAMLAIPTGLWIDRRRRVREQQEQADVALAALWRELDENRSRLETFLSVNVSAAEEQIIAPNLGNDAWQAAHELEILVGLDYDLYKQLLEVYEQIELIDQLSKTLWQIFFTPAPDFSFIETRTRLLNETLRTESELLLPSIERLEALITQDS